MRTLDVRIVVIFVLWELGILHTYLLFEATVVSSVRTIRYRFLRWLKSEAV